MSTDQREAPAATTEPSPESAMLPTRSATLPAPIASRRHLAGFLLIGIAIVAAGMRAQHAALGSAPGQLGSHAYVIPTYLSAIAMDAALLYYCWAGVHRRGGTLETLSGGRWNSVRSLLTDVAIAIPSWLVWEGAAVAVHALLGANHAKAVDSLLPHSVAEILTWIVVSIAAGVCEELAFRGYLQRQLETLTGSLAWAVLGQGVVFGLFHSYQGWKNVGVISVLGVLFGVLAAWRRNLRTNVLVHAWSDIWGGWLQAILWK